MSVLGTLRVRLGLESADFSRGVRDARRNLTTLEDDVRRFRSSTLGGAVSLTALGAALRSSIQVANEYDSAQRQLAATARLTGISLGFLESVAKQAEQQFKLSTLTANALTIELTKLGAKAGDLSTTSDALAAFLDIGAARGLNAEQTLQAVRQAILGIDEGTDKLFSKNPSVIYAEFAASIGTTAGKLTDQQKAQALLNAAMQDGSKVQGEYANWLASSQGAQAQFGQSIREVANTLGQALQPALESVIPPLSNVIRLGARSIEGFQMIGASAATIPELVKVGFAELRQTFARSLLHMTNWAIEVERLLNRVRIAFDQEPVDFTTGMLGRIRDMSHDAADDVRAARVELERMRQARDEMVQSLEWSPNGGSVAAVQAPTLPATVPVPTQPELPPIPELRTGLEAELAGMPPLRLPVSLEPVSAIDLPTGTVTPQDEPSRFRQLQDPALGLAGQLIASGGKMDAASLGGSLGSMAGTLTGIPGASMITGAVGTLVGKLFDKEKPEEKRQTRALETIEANTRAAATVLEQTRRDVQAARGFVNVPSTFSLPSYAPRGNVSLTVNVTNSIDRVDDPAAFALQLQQTLGPLLANELRRVGIGR